MVHAARAGLGAAAWVRCRAPAVYRYEPAPAGPFRARVDDLEGFDRVLALGSRELRRRVEAGARLLVEVGVAGRLVLLAEPAASEAPCAGATHYVSAIVVGGYRLAEARGSVPEGGDEGGGSGHAGWAESAGVVQVCAAARQASPRAECAVPLGFALKKVGGR
jgi:hypothetical protein